MSFCKVACMVVMGLLVLSGVARAEQEVDPKALAKAQYMLRQMSTEREALQSENARLKADLDALKAKKTSTDGALSKSKETLRDAQDNLDRTLAEKQQAEELATGRGRQLEQCTIKNTKLYEINGELLQRYTNKGVMDALARREPFTGLKMVEMENLVQDLHDKLDAQRVVTETERVAPSQVIPRANTGSGTIRTKREGEGTSPQTESVGGFGRRGVKSGPQKQALSEAHPSPADEISNPTEK